MRSAKLIILAILILINFIFINFPGLKLAVYGILILIILNYLYVRFIRKYLYLGRDTEEAAVFIGINEEITLSVDNKMIIPIHAIEIKDRLDLNLTVTHQPAYIVSFTKKGIENIKLPVRGRKGGNI